MLKTLKKLAPEFGGDNQQNREAWLIKVLSAIPPGSRILDAGAGELRNKKYCTHLQYVSQDLCAYHGNGDGTGLQTGTWDTGQIDIISNITSIPLPDNSFDAILCSEVLEHIPDPTLAIDEFSRLLKKNGTLILTVPFCSLTHFAPYHFVSGLNRYWYIEHLQQKRFDIIELSTNGDWFRFLAQEVRRLPVIMDQYGNGFTWLGLLVSYLFTKYLASVSRKCLGTEALLCYGYHCLARKMDGDDVLS